MKFINKIKLKHHQNVDNWYIIFIIVLNNYAIIFLINKKYIVKYIIADIPNIN